MDFDWSTLALQTVNFAILVWLLHRFLYRPVLRMVDARRADVEQQYAGARSAEAKAGQALVDIEARRAALEAERDAMMAAAAAQAEKLASERHDRAAREATALLEEARRTVAAEREAASAELRRTAMDLGLEIARRLLADIPPVLRAEAWLERAEQHLAGLSAQERAALVAGPDGHRLRVVAAIAVPKNSHADWQGRLGQALGGPVEVGFAEDPGLVAGIELHFQASVLHLSWRATLDTLQAELDTHDNAG